MARQAQSGALEETLLPLLVDIRHRPALTDAHGGGIGAVAYETTMRNDDNIEVRMASYPGPRTRIAADERSITLIASSGKLQFVIIIMVLCVVLLGRAHLAVLCTFAWLHLA